MACDGRLVLTVNPGGTSTKLGLFRETELIFQKSIRHLPEELEQFDSTLGQLDYRRDMILAALEEEGLVGALRKRLQSVEHRAGIEAQFVADPLLTVPACLEEALYYIAQEALNNALKHAGASSVVVRISAGEERLTLEVADDGCGFAPAAPGDQGGMGLETMRQRAERLGSHLSIESAPGAGTSVRVEVPRAERTANPRRGM